MYISANDIVVTAPNVSVVDPGGVGMTVLVGGVTTLSGTSTIITGLSTINGAPYFEFPGSVSSISGYDLGFINIDAATSTITMSANGTNNIITAGADGTLTVGAPGLTTALTEISTIAFLSATAGLISNAVELSFTVGGGIGGQITNLSTINSVAYPPPVAAPKQATYYKSAAQNLNSGSTDLTFDLSGAWNNTGGYITHTDGTEDFTVVQTGLYQIEFNALILANTATWGTGSNRTISFDITRSPTAEQAIIAQAFLAGIHVGHHRARLGRHHTGHPGVTKQIQHALAGLQHLLQPCPLRALIGKAP
jgi:hypothetical protein